MHVFKKSLINFTKYQGSSRKKSYSVQWFEIRRDSIWLRTYKWPNFGGVYTVLWVTGSRLCEVAEFQHKCSIEKLNLSLALNCHGSTSPPFCKTDVGGCGSCSHVVSRLISAIIWSITSVL